MNPDQKAEAIYAKMMENDHCTRWLQAEALVIKEGYCKLKMQVRREMLNGHSILHGGIAYTFADSAFAFASNSYGRVAVSINGSMQFSKSAKEGDILFAEAKCLNLTHKTADFDVDITDASGTVFYRFRGTVYRKSTEILTQS